ncbi:MAG: alpha/beta hydrolase [Gammaproteobacteria bacterium]|nr:alpha/beta hydrolase [Gammaproteobacteria bacterium]
MRVRCIAESRLRIGLLLAGLCCVGGCARPSPPAPPAPATVANTGSAAVAGSDIGTAAPASAARLSAAGQTRIVLSRDNVHIDYRVYGRGDPAVVLVHGWAGDANYWSGQIDALADRYTVVAVNLAGHGASGRNRSDWSIQNYAQDVAAVAREIPNGQLVLIGHSMGAVVVLAATPIIGPRVIGIVAVEALRTVGEPTMPPQEIERRLAPFSADFIGETRRLVTGSLFPKDTNTMLAQKVAYDMSLEPAEVAIPSMRSLQSFDLTGLLPAIHVPVYAINSDLAPTHEARIRKVLPDFALDVLHHSSHFPMLEAPARFNPLLLKDVASIVQRAAH